MSLDHINKDIRFQHTAARRRLLISFDESSELKIVSTHSRAEAAATIDGAAIGNQIVSTHSRAEAAALR